MSIRLPSMLALAMLSAVPLPSLAQQQAGRPEDTEVWTPVPKIVTPGPSRDAPPSDAIVLLEGSNLDQWVSPKDKSPARWTLANGVMTVNKPAGNIETKRSFTDYQLHLEGRG